MSSRAIFLPGSVLPAEPAYGALLAALGPDADVVAKDLEVYADVDPPSDYSLDTEVDGVLREATERGWEQFHLAGYSSRRGPAAGTGVRPSGQSGTSTSGWKSCRPTAAPHRARASPRVPPGALAAGGSVDAYARSALISPAAAFALRPMSGNRSAGKRCCGPQTLTIATGRSRSFNTGADAP